MILTKPPAHSEPRIGGPLFTALLLLVLLGLAGCTERETRAETAAREGILLLGNGTEPGGLDPHLVTGVPENRIISALVEGLIAYHPTDDSAPEPGVAKSWEPNHDYSEWTFHLHPEARWSNGDPVRAQDFVYSWERMLNPLLGAQYANMLYALENAEAYHTGQITDFTKVGVKALDERTLHVRLLGPTPYFLSMLKHYSWFPVHPPTIEKFGGPTARFSGWTRPGNFVGNGAFQLTRWSVNQIIQVRPNPHYWDAAKVRLKGIDFFPIDNFNTEERVFLAGALHKTSTVPINKVPYYKENRRDILKLEPYLGTYFYRLNVEEGPLRNPLVRQALALAVDREHIVTRVTLAGEQPAFAYTPRGMGAYASPPMMRYDPDRARALLAEAGFPGGEGIPPLNILYNTSEGHRKIAEAMQQMWARELGIEITLTNQEWKVYLETQRNLNYEISRSAWIGDFMDPLTFLEMWTTGNGNNNTGWSNPEFDALIARSRLSSNPQEHYQTLLRAEEILLTELPIVPIYWYTTKSLMHPAVRGFSPKLLDNHNYKYISFDLSLFD
jgi:oligopeptide transport system substrate-binding protein